MEYLIRVTRTTEFETRVEADDPLAAADLARMEATGNSVITNEQIEITLPQDELQRSIEGAAKSSAPARL